MRGFVSMINEMKMKYSSNIQFRFIYIAEAHAVDEWPVRSGRFTNDGKPILVSQPTTLQERSMLAEKFLVDYNFHLETFIDIPEKGDPFEQAYAPWPLRFFLIDQEDRLAFVSEPVEGSSDKSFVQLMELLNQHSNSVE